MVKPPTNQQPQSKKILNKQGILTLSDIHLGHRGTPADFILKNLELFFNNFRVKDNFQELKAIIIGGDLWDEVVQLSNDSIPYFVVFWYKLCAWCHRKGIVLRLLKGTPSHDGNQGNTVESYTAVTFPDLDFKYVKDLSIEKHSGLGLSILYVPDECRPKADDVYNDVLSLLHAEGLEQVDIAIMHGMFKYQLGTIPMGLSVHHEALYLPLVKYFISIGHIHTASQYERIYAQGSFDRLAHNEEGEKGAYYHLRTSKDKWESLFLPNVHAKVYKSITLKSNSVDAVALIDKTAKAMPDFSHLRILAEEGHDIFKGFEVFVKKYPCLTLTRKVIDKKKKVAVKATSESYKPLVLNRETLTEAIFQEISLKHNLSLEDTKHLYQELENLHT